MKRGSMPIGRRERAKRDKRVRILAAAGELFTRHGVRGVTTQQSPTERTMRSGRCTCMRPRLPAPSRPLWCWRGLACHEASGAFVHPGPTTRSAQPLPSWRCRLTLGNAKEPPSVADRGWFRLCMVTGPS